MKNQKPDQNSDPMLTAALQYAKRGWRVFPNHKPTIHADGSVTCSCGSSNCKPKGRGKHPRIRAWQKRATTNATKIREWWRDHPATNIGIATGWDSDLIVLDVDAGHGFEHLQDWEKQGKRLPETVTVQTGSGGRQFYFHFPDLDFDPTTKAALCDFEDIDVRADGGQVVAPPSVHPSGNHYAWLDGCSPDDVDVADPPDWLLEMLRRDGKTRVEPRLPRGDSVDDELPSPEAHTTHLHPYLNPKLVSTKDGRTRRSLDGSLKQEWVDNSHHFRTERQLVAALGDLWLPPEVRPRLLSDGLTLETDDDRILDYQKMRRGELHPRSVAGGRWTDDGEHRSKGKPVTQLEQTLGLLLGQVRLLVPWDYRVYGWGNRIERDEFDTLLIPMTVLTPQRETVDVWQASPQTRQRLVQPIAKAVQAVANAADTPLQVSYWADGESDIWIAIHTSELQSKQDMHFLRQTIEDLLIDAASEASSSAEPNSPSTVAQDLNVIYEIGLGNLGSNSCPIPFSFCETHLDRMMMALDPATGEFYPNQVEYLLSVRRLPGLSEVIAALPALQTPAGLAAAARRRVLAALELSGGDDHYPDLVVRLVTTADDVRQDWETYVAWRDGRRQPCVADMPNVAKQPRIALPPTMPATTRQEGHQEAYAFGHDRWRSEVPASIRRLHTTVIGKGALARVLAAMRDEGLLENPTVGTGVLLDFEDEVVRRYVGINSESEVRGELQDSIRSALAKLESLYCAGIRLSSAQQEQCQRLAETIHGLLPTRGSSERPSVDAIAALLQCLVIKSACQRQAEWTLDFVAVKAGWGADIGSGASSISPADRNRLTRFMRRICEDYGRDSSGTVDENETPPLLPLIRCDRKGWQGVPSLYTFLWENWGDGFKDLCQNPCPARVGGGMSDDELIGAGWLQRRKRQAG